MVKSNNIGQKAKSLLLGIFLLTTIFHNAYGRDGIKLYSIGVNPLWNSTGAWSRAVNGVSSGLVPQANDTLVIDRMVFQNINFSLSGKGLIIITSTGVLRGDNMSIGFGGNSGLQCFGEIKSGILVFAENAGFMVEDKGIVTVKESLQINSSFNHYIFGKLTVWGKLSVMQQVKIGGNGVAEAAHFEGSGKIFSISNLSLIPDGSLVTEANWIGTVNSNWNDPANWTGGTLPVNTSNVSVLVSSKYPLVSGEQFCNNLYVNSSASITIQPSAFFTVSGKLSVIGAGRLLLKNTLSEKASLILKGTVTGKIQSEYTLNAGKRQFIASPVNSSTSALFSNAYIRTYDEVNSRWSDYLVPGSSPLQDMKGYEVYSPTSQTKIFEGTPNQDNKSFTISNSGNGMNLAGNPFPGYIDWEEGNNEAWQRSSIASAIYYPDPSGSGNYAVYVPGGDNAVAVNNGSRFIAPMQGFFVKASKQGTLSVNGNSRINRISDFKQELKTNSLVFKLSKSEGNCDEVLMRVNSNSTFGFDNDMDAVKLEGTGSASLFMQSGNEKYAVNTIPAVNSSLTIPLIVTCSQSSMFTISVSGSFNFEYRYPVILRDKELNTLIDLRSDSAYSFYHTPQMNSNRFELQFDFQVGVDEKTDVNTQVSIVQGEVKVTGKTNEVFTACLYTIDGKLIAMEKGVLSEGIRLSTANQATGICILQMFNGTQKLTKKIYIP